MHSTIELKAQMEAREQMLRDLQPLVRLLNGLTDRRLLWQTAFGRNDYVDVFGIPIPAGQTHYRKGQPTTSYDPLRLSVPSMQKVVEVLFAGNLEGTQMAEKVNKERLEEMRRSMQRV